MRKHTDEADTADRPPAEPPARGASPAPLHIDNDLPCYKCGYNLRTLQQDASCPECGTPVRNSVAQLKTLAWPFNAQSACKLLALGMFLVFVAGIGLIPWLIGVAILLHAAPRQPASLQLARHASWVSAIGFAAALSLVDTATFGETLPTLTALLCLVGHYISVAWLGICIATELKLKAIRKLGIALLYLLPMLGLMSLVLQHIVPTNLRNGMALVITVFAIAMLACLTAGFFWTYLETTIHHKKQNLLRGLK